MFHFYRPSRIAIKLIKALIIFSSLITLVMTSIQLLSEYERDIDAIEARFHQVGRGYLDSVATNVWQADADRLNLLVKGIIESPDFKYAVVRGSDGKSMASSGQITDEQVVKKIYPLTYTHRGAKREIGELEVVASLTEIYNRTLSRFGLILLSNAIKTFFVSLFMFSIVYSLLAAPLNSIAGHLRNIDFSASLAPLRLNSRLFSREQDEMDELAAALNSLQSRLHDEFKARKDAEMELREAHDELEKRVLERTRKLSDEVAIRKNAELQLKKATSAVKNSSHAIFVTDMNGVIEYVNPRFTEVFGYLPDEIMGQKPSIFQSGETAEESYEELWNTIKSGKEWRGDLKDRRKNGELFWASVSIVPVRNDNNAVTNFIAMQEDITERKQVEQELHQHRNRLEELVLERTAEVKEKADKLERALGREKDYNVLQQKFVSLVSHEFRTPLAIIDGVAQRFIRSKDTISPDELELRSNIVRSAVARMTGLIDTTLYASSLDEGKVEVRMEPCDIKGLLTEVCDRQSELSPSHQIEIDADDLPDTVSADPRLLDQIFTNLLSNAVKYSPDNPVIQIRGWNDGGNALISISDQGVGIPEKDMPNMFGRFFRATNAEGIRGTGIGLNVVKEFIRLHGGSIGVDSMEGEGSTFTIRLPTNGAVQ